GLALYGLWTIIQGSFGWGIALIAGGAALTMLPPLVGSTLSGIQSVLTTNNIATSPTDAGVVLNSFGEFRDSCDASIPVDLSYLQQQASANGYGVNKNTDGTITITNPDGTQTTVADVNKAMQYLGQVVGTGQCVALLQKIDPSVGNSQTWVKGEQAINSDLKPGTFIGTFECGGGTKYCSQAGNDTSHVAVVVEKKANGDLVVMDQYAGKAAQIRTIRADGAGVVNNAKSYYVIKSPGKA
ncbi:MAG: BPSL0067 family protein, partial [Alphaproteobacteria bacterium]